MRRKKPNSLSFFSCPLATTYAQMAMLAQRRTDLLESKIDNLDEIIEYIEHKQVEIQAAKQMLERLKVEIRAATLLKNRAK